jgi:hypothetical protein
VFECAELAGGTQSDNGFHNGPHKQPETMSPVNLTLDGQRHQEKIQKITGRDDSAVLSGRKCWQKNPRFIILCVPE